MKKLKIATVVLGLCGFLSIAHSHGNAHRDAQKETERTKEQMAWGIAGDKAHVDRTVQVSMSDNMRFTPAAVQVKEGETIHFVISNHGKLKHEMVVGTSEENLKHVQMMREMPGMQHDEPYMAHVEPGKSAEMVWTFNKPGQFEFACLIDGHYQAGMKGDIVVGVSQSRGLK